MGISFWEILMFADAATEDFFGAHLDHMIDLRYPLPATRYPLAVLASRMPWQRIEASVAHLFSRQGHAGQAMPDLDLFGEAPAPMARQSNAGRPRVPLRTMIALLYLKHAFDLSDEAVVERWSETPRWQFFSGRSYYEERLPCDATTLVKFRRLLGEEGVEELLAQTVNLAVSLKLIPAAALATVVVGSTVQEKAVAHPTDSKLLETARAKLVSAAQGAGIELKQTFAREGRLLQFKAGRYAHAKQFKRMRRVIKRQSTVVGRLVREIKREASVLTERGVAVRQSLDSALAKASRIAEQSCSRKNTSGIPKLYAWHAPEVECIAKGKSRTPYEFGVKVGIVMTLKHNLIVGARAFTGNPYDGHTLREQLQQAAILMQDTGEK
jgi:IS5 family transposase